MPAARYMGAMREVLAYLAKRPGQPTDPQRIGADMGMPPDVVRSALIGLARQGIVTRLFRGVYQYDSNEPGATLVVGELPPSPVVRVPVVPVVPVMPCLATAQSLVELVVGDKQIRLSMLPAIDRFRTAAMELLEALE